MLQVDKLQVTICICVSKGRRMHIHLKEEGFVSSDAGGY